MKVLMIAGDRNVFVPDTAVYERLQLQRRAVERLDVAFWGRGALFEVFFVKSDYDIVTTQDPFWRGLIGLFLARRFGARLNLQVHADLSAQSLWRRVLARLLLRRADSIRVVSRRIKQQVEAWGVKKPVWVLPIYIDIEKFRAIAPQTHPRKTILWIGRFEKEKDPGRAVEVFEEVREKGMDAGLVVLGKGSLEPVLRRIAHGLPVEFPGWQDPRPYLAVADVVLCTSKHESYGASIIEALAARVPVVAPDVGVAREAGAVVAAREALAEEVLKVLESGARGALKLELLSLEEWVRQWKETLL